MNAAIFAEWFRRRGHQVVQTASSFWVNLGKRVYQAFPYHWLIQPGEDELDELFYTHRSVALRYSTSLTARVGHFSYHVIQGEPAYDLETLGKKARYDVRQGLKNCHVTRISFQRLANEGWPLLADTMDRQGRQGAISFNSWHLLCKAASELPGFEAWGALVGKNLGASALTLQMEGYNYILYQQSHRKYLQAKVNNALCFALTREMKMRPNVSLVHYGLHSLDAPESVDQFKFRMGYVAKPVRQRVVLHPWLKYCINGGSHAVVRKLLRLSPGNLTFAKVEGMMRFYLEGLRPLREQRKPDCLKKDLTIDESTNFPGI